MGTIGDDMIRSVKKRKPAAKKQRPSSIDPQPSPNGANGRGTDGRFIAGNPGGPGNPRAKQTADLRATIRAAVSDQDMEDIVAALIKKAKTGDVVAVRELLDRLIGKSSQKVEMDVQTHHTENREDHIEAALRFDILHMLPVGLLECAVNDGVIAPKQARRAERIKQYIEQTRKEIEAEPDEPLGSGKYGEWRNPPRA